jgi:hypothetical protein
MKGIIYDNCKECEKIILKSIYERSRLWVSVNSLSKCFQHIMNIEGFSSIEQGISFAAEWLSALQAAYTSDLHSSGA